MPNPSELSQTLAQRHLIDIVPPGTGMTPQQEQDGLWNMIPVGGAGALASEAAGPVSDLIGTYKNAWNTVRPELKGLSKLIGEPAAAVPSAATGIAPYTSTLAPKAGGVLEEVLSHAGVKQATGEPLSAIEQRLLSHFAGLIR